MSLTKRCSECGQIKAKEQFPRSRLRLGGRSSRCLLCGEKHMRGGQRADRTMHDNAADRLRSEARRSYDRNPEGGFGG